MPHVSLIISPAGPLIDFWIGVSVPRSAALQKAGQPVPNPILIRGLIDTGASCTNVDPTILSQLGVVSTGSVPVHTPSTKAGAPHMADQFDVSIILSHPKINWQIHAIPIIASDLVHQGIHALIGRDILANCLFTYDGQGNVFCLAF
ncbi:MAG: hypothetical protein HY735_17810 [Verrucomicrobia bacterium]|nr:hypothetical protein [Verrucomicrobiota bacterium]